ncbi:MAG: hypothetical protein ACRDKE_06850, partial [Solirubrobacterales bacterium]
MNRSLIALALAVVASLVIASVAVAATPITVTPDASEFAPILSGNSVVYATTAEDAGGIHESIHVWRSSPGALPVEIAAFPVGNHDHHLSL